VPDILRGSVEAHFRCGGMTLLMTLLRITAEFHGEMMLKIIEHLMKSLS